MFNLAILRHNRLRPVSNYLFGIVFRVFPTRSRFHKFQYCSIFKVLRQPPRGQLIYYISSSFFCQALFEIFLSRPAFRPARCLCDSLFILLHPRSFVKTFFEVFFCRPGSPFCRPPAASSLLLSGASLRSSGIWLCNRCCRSRQLDYNTTGTARCQHLFSIFFKFFCLDFSPPISSRVCRGKAQNLGPRCPAPAGKTKAAALPGRESAAVWIKKSRFQAPGRRAAVTVPAAPAGGRRPRRRGAGRPRRGARPAQGAAPPGWPPAWR